MTSFTLPRLDEIDDSEVKNGFGSLKTDVGNLPLQQLANRSRVVGLAVQTTIKQTFYNPFDECIEATYVFPIEGEQAVVGCEIWVADRLVRAELKERGQARSDYRRAIHQGHRAALLEQNRGETFSMKVGNIPPGEAIQVRIQTIGNLAVAHGEWTLRMPLVVAPRYTSGFPLPGASVGNGTAVDTDQVPDASTVTPPTWLPGFPSPVNLSIEVDVQPGNHDSGLGGHADWPSQIRSSLHAVVVESDGDDQSVAKSCRIQIRPGEKVDRDFILRGPIESSKVVGSLLCDPDSGTFAIHLVPTSRKSDLPKNVVFLLDRSGSMSGWKMEAARRGISRLIDTLGPNDRFQVLAFDNNMESPSERSHSDSLQTASDANRYQAVRWLAGIRSRGGTEMGRAIQHGLQMFQSNENGRGSASIVLVTDGQITGEDSLLRLLGEVPKSQRPRLFCLGIDRAVNAGVLQRLAKFTGGIYEGVESEKRLDEIMQRFGDEIGSPSITDLRIEAVDDTGSITQIAPANPTLLYPGRPLSIYGRSRQPSSLRIAVHGTLASGEPWSQTIEAETVTLSSDLVNLLHSMWGRAILRELEDEFAGKSAPDRLLQEEIVRCSLETQVLSRFTAFVAVDESERVNTKGSTHAINQPVELPEGWKPMHSAPLGRDRLISLPSQPSAARPIARRSMSVSKPTGGPVLPKQFANLILQKGIVTMDQLSEAEALSRSTSTNVGNALVRMQYATAEEVAQVTAESYKMPYVDLRHTQIPIEVIELIPESVARENGVMPLSESGGTLTVLVSDPTDLETVEKLRFILNRNIQTMIASPDAILQSINLHYGQVEGESADSMLQEFTDTAIDFTETSDDYLELHSDESLGLSDEIIIDGMLEDDDICMIQSMPLPTPSPMRSRRQRTVKESSSPSDAPVIRLVNLIVSEAIQMRATHVILTARPDVVVIQYVIDGDVVDREHVPRRMLSAIVARLKILAKVDVSITDQLQTGTINITVGATASTHQVHFAPTSDGTTMLIELGRVAQTAITLREHAMASGQPNCVREWWEARAMQSTLQ
ncbi:ATPase, T2SS/T4P/T4SS family [Novipirellula sp.]|uniref:ATPase, T2SS/T4P/T4SS family n=1 Tax=Novipirellula sp. TaxID=2795430 RepID=UPI003566CD12